MPDGRMTKEEAALRVARTGNEKPHVGPIVSADPGRTDTHAIDVHAGSYVIPADIVSGLGEGNTLAGMKILDKMFTATPYTTGGPATMQSIVGGAKQIKAGGKVSSPSKSPQVPIVAAGGEYVIAPDKVTEIGSGDMDRGHKILDAFVKTVRRQHIKTLTKLPGPSK